MKKFVLVLSLVSICFIPPCAAGSDDFPKIQISGGYSFDHTRDANYTKGWDAELAANFNHWFGVVADFSGHYMSNEGLYDLN